MGKFFSYVTAIAAGREETLRVSSDLFEASFETPCAGLASCNIKMSPSVTNDNLGGCSTAERS